MITETLTGIEHPLGHTGWAKCFILFIPWSPFALHQKLLLSLPNSSQVWGFVFAFGIQEPQVLEVLLLCIMTPGISLIQIHGCSRAGLANYSPRGQIWLATCFYK